MSEYEIIDFEPSKNVKEVCNEENKEDNEKEEEEEEFDIDFDNIDLDMITHTDIDPISYEYKYLGFDLDLLKSDKLHVNLIYFDTNISNGENYRYYNYFKVDVEGEFQAIDNLDLLARYLEAIKIKKISFIAITSGSRGKDVISICKKFSLVKEVIIFCRNYKYNEHYLKEYPGYVKKVSTSIKDVYQYIKIVQYNNDFSKIQQEQFVFSYDQIKMSKQLEQCPVISSYEYDNYYFLIHRAYAHFFDKIEDKKSLPVFEDSHFKNIKEYLEYPKIFGETEKKI